MVSITENDNKNHLLKSKRFRLNLRFSFAYIATYKSLNLCFFTGTITVKLIDKVAPYGELRLHRSTYNRRLVHYNFKLIYALSK